MRQRRNLVHRAASSVNGESEATRLGHDALRHLTRYGLLRSRHRNGARSASPSACVRSLPDGRTCGWCPWSSTAEDRGDRCLGRRGRPPSRWNLQPLGWGVPPPAHRRGGHGKDGDPGRSGSDDRGGLGGDQPAGGPNERALALLSGGPLERDRGAVAPAISATEQAPSSAVRTHARVSSHRELSASSCGHRALSGYGPGGETETSHGGTPRADQR